ncbi:hypothetical protein V5O48_019085, partial [Marasmius crinis-equi]
MLNLLDNPASRTETFFRFACAQRHVLYLLARYEWVEKYRAQFEGVTREDPPVVNPTIVGAFAEQDANADNLYHAGIPVWYSRWLSEAPAVRVDRVEVLISDSITHAIPLRCGSGFLDCSDATPSHKVIYEGLAGKPERYLAMGNYLRSRCQHPSSFSNQELRSSTSVIHTIQTSSPSTIVPFGFYPAPTPASKKSKP